MSQQGGYGEYDNRDYYRPPPEQPEYRREERNGDYARQYDSRPDPRDARRPEPPRYDDRRGSAGGNGGASGAQWEGERDYKRARYDDYDQGRGYAAPSARREDDYLPPRQPYSQDYGRPPPSSQYSQQSYDSYGGYPAAQHRPDPSYASYASQSDDRRPPYSRYDDRPPPPSSSRDQRDYARPPYPSSSRPRSDEIPSASVVLLGLPTHVNDGGLRTFLEDLGASVDDTHVILDRATGISKRYGFAKFASVEHARAFVEPNFPAVLWRQQMGIGYDADNGIKIKINYSVKTGGWREDQGADARMTEDKRRVAEAVEESRPYYVNNGTRDIGGSVPKQILLLRGLDTLTTEEDILASLGTLSGRPGDEVRAGAIKRILLVRDRATRSSWGYAFVHCVDVRLATEILANVLDARTHPGGYRIRSSIIAFSFCHENSFVPIYAPSEFSFKGDGGQELSYWDHKAFVSAFIPPQNPTNRKPATPLAATPIPKETKIDPPNSDADMEAFFSSLDAEVKDIIPNAQAGPVASTSVSSSSSSPVIIAPPATERHELPRKPSLSSLAPGQSTEPLPVARKAKKTQPDVKKSQPDTKTAQLNEKKKSNELIQTKKANVNISKWNTKQIELATDIPAPLTDAKAALPSTTDSAAVPSTSSAIPSATSTAEVVDFGDAVAKVCLLCQRQFKSEPDLKRHINLSALHKTNLADPTIVSAALLRKSTASAKPPATPPIIPVPTTTYVDRSALRRETHQQPDQPMPEAKKLKKSAPGPPPVAPTLQPNKHGIEETNVGSKMLEKMGWTRGGGLGTEGTGIVAPVIANSFVKGAGLGAAQGVAIGTSYKEQVLESSRNRMAKEGKNP